MADFPRIKWLNVDGQQVPFTEPQHFTGNGDETVRTGHDNPLPVANYTQDENGIWLPVSKDNPVPTQVTGSNVEFGKTENVFERKIRTESEGSRVTKPKWAKGCLIELVIHGITGSFGTDEGVEMTTFSRFKGGIGTGTRLRSVDVTKTGTIQHLWFTGVSLDDAESSNIDFKLTNYPMAEEVAIGFTIIGNFESGEGIDSEINLFWMR